MPAVFSMDNPLVNVYFFYHGILGLKMLSMSVLTGLKRHKHKAFVNKEDTIGVKDFKPRIDENVERVRRAHLNDLENILVFSFVSFGYIMTNPAVGTATTLFRAFTAARVIHSFVYAVCVIPQPARALSFGVGYCISIYMAAQTIMHFA